MCRGCTLRALSGGVMASQFVAWDRLAFGTSSLHAVAHENPDSLISTLSPYSILLAISGTMSEALLDVLRKKRDAITFDKDLAGATFVDEPVVVDGNLVTSRGWPDLPFFMPAFLKVVAAPT